MPAPMRTTSGSKLNVSGMLVPPHRLWCNRLSPISSTVRSGRSALWLACSKWNGRTQLQHDIRAPPRLFVGQSPTMSAAGGILCVQNVPWTDQKMFTVACLEIERPAQRYDQLHRGRIVPGERATRSRLPKGDRLHRGLAAQQIAALTGLEGLWRLLRNASFRRLPSIFARFESCTRSFHGCPFRAASVCADCQRG